MRFIVKWFADFPKFVRNYNHYRRTWGRVASLRFSYDKTTMRRRNVGGVIVQGPAGTGETLKGGCYPLEMEEQSSLRHNQ